MKASASRDVGVVCSAVVTQVVLILVLLFDTKQLLPAFCVKTQTPIMIIARFCNCIFGLVIFVKSY